MTPTDSTIQLHPVNQLEWQGKLAQAAGQGASFSLLLALQLGSGVPPAQVLSQEEEAVSDSNFPARLNYYRRPPLDASEGGVNQTTSRLLSSGTVDDARLWQCMHPDPHTLRNDSKKLSADILSNCSLATQQAHQKTVTADTIDEDPTLLDELVKQAERFAA
ncbi:VC2046/SO_2500 family protein [Alteromonas sp. ASW11-19]|uniref:VC2046/SO_2500 family protein n=1 Tax=Alteromonas salexigens TaxID=2982530 RepID=A0ABT2VM88_9ALTE|nr:VC2046/SO_2500 family protein [Alteromonas salexigens]MCU7554205.1 VC2046/SO_2500 family protein [Alteromonas salexigens]